MRLGGTHDRFVKVLSHAGKVIAFSSATRSAGDPTTSAGEAHAIGYSVLNPVSENPGQDASWTAFEFLEFPRELRPAGRSVITVDFGAAQIATPDVPFEVVSDNRYLYLFRQSPRGTLYFDRFVYDDVTGRVAGASEVRFRRSRKPDIPLDRRDTLGSTDMNERRFVAPTLELDFVHSVSEGRFAAVIVPSELPGVDRWQIFAQDSQTGRLNSFSLARAADGSFDLADAIDEQGNVPPERAIELRSAGAALALATGPGVALYNLQEWLKDEYGRASLHKLEARLMVAVGTGPGGELAMLDFGVGKDGRLANAPDSLPVEAAPPIGTALRFTRGTATRVTVPALATGAKITIEAWVAPQEYSSGLDVIVQSATDAQAPFLLALRDGTPIFAGADGQEVSADRPLDTHGWTHLAGVWDAKPTLYVNARPFEGAEAPPDAPSPPAAGYLVGGAEGLTGCLDEIRLWQIARTQADVLATMCTGLSPASAGWNDLLGYWKLDEPADASRFTTVPNSSRLGAAADGVLTGPQWVATSAPSAASMAPVAWDANGLTTCTALLGFAAAGAAPVLFDGADSTVHAYFSAKSDGALLAVHYSPVVARASYELSWQATDASDPTNDQAGVVAMIARQPGTAMNATATVPPLVAVETATEDAEQATVTLRSYTGYQEQWPGVPLELGAFTAILNGEALQLSADPVEKTRPTPTYDYRQVVVTSAGGQRAPAPGPGTGSAIFRALPELPSNGCPALVTATAQAPAAAARAGVDGWWQAAPPLPDIDMTELGQYLQVLDEAGVQGYDGPLAAERDVAVEAWVRYVPNELEEDATLFVFNKPGRSQYLVGIDSAGHVLAVNGEIAARTDAVVPRDGSWTHLAASYRTDFGIQLGGARFLDAGRDRSLDSSDAVTIEGWVQVDGAGAQVVAAKWDPQRGRSWKLSIDAAGKLALEVSQSVATGQASHTTTGTTVLKGTGWHHVAGVYDVSFARVVALMFDSGSFVNIPALAHPPTDGVTVAMWVKLVGPSRAETEILIMSADPDSALPMALMLHEGIPTFTVWDEAQHSISATAALRADDWIHIAGSYQRGQPIALAIDGVAVGAPSRAERAQASPQPSASVDATAEAAYTVGGLTSKQSLVGMINELSLWNRGLTLDEIRQKIQQPLAATERGLAGYWRFNDLYGTTVMDLAGTANGQVVRANFVRVDKGAFAQKVFVDGRIEAFERVLDPLVVGEAPVTIGAAHHAEYLQGAVGEMRLWNTGRMNWQIAYFAARDAEPNAQGLVALWPFDTGRGRVAFDAKGDNNALIRDGQIELTDDAVDRMWIRTTFKAAWRVFIDGAAVPARATAAPAAGFGAQQASIAALTRAQGALVREYTGELQELRVWREQLTDCQVRDRMFMRLSGGEPGLAAYWPLDDGSGVAAADRSGAGAHATWEGDGAAPKWQLSGAPVGSEAPQVRCVPGSLATARNAVSEWACGVAGYGVLEPRARGELAAVLKLAYAYVDRAAGALELLAGPAVGDLELQYVGQVQLTPTLVGYIEGPPPLPAENLKLFPGDPPGYAGAASVQLDESGSRMFTYTASRDVGSDTTVTAQLGFALDSDTHAGLGVTQKVFGVDFSIGLETSAEETIGTLAEAQVEEEALASAKKYVEVSGRWLENKYKIDNGVGELFYPRNAGYALVRSGTGDVFAMRLAATGTLVGYSTRPNPDIPEDFNIVMFKLKDAYVKNGTLDGWIGYEPDQSYSFLKPGEHGSYFKPLEAYALKQAIERETQLRKAWFDNFDAAGIGRREKARQPGSVDIAEEGRSLANVLMGVTTKAALSSEEWKARMARRNMVNTYVWTAEGGLYAEEQQFLAVREESSGGSYQMTTRVGVYTELSFNVGPSYSLNALFGSHIATRAMKADREQWQYTLDVTCVGERYIGLIEESEDGLRYTDKPSPGKVRAYRFMTLMLAPSKRNFEDFEDVVDEDWLYQRGAFAGAYDPDAFALRQALTSPNEAWRVLHRVTYVSRVPPATQREGESLALDVRKPDELSILANAVAIEELQVDLALPNPLAKVSEKADALLAQLVLNPVWGALLAARKSEVKRDLVTYMGDYYGIPTSS